MNDDNSKRLNYTRRITIRIVHGVTSVCGSKGIREPFQGHWRVLRLRRWIFRTRWQWDRWLTTLNISHYTNLKRGGESYEPVLTWYELISHDISHNITSGGTCTQEISQHHEVKVTPLPKWEDLSWKHCLPVFYIDSYPIDSYPTDRSLIRKSTRLFYYSCSTQIFSRQEWKKKGEEGGDT
jgi:hypothetical protein